MSVNSLTNPPKKTKNKQTKKNRKSMKKTTSGHAVLCDEYLGTEGVVLFPPWAQRFYSTRRPSARSASPGNVHSAFCGTMVSSVFPSQLQGLLTSGVSHCCRPSQHCFFPSKAGSPLAVRLVLMEWALCFSLMCAKVWEGQKTREGEISGMTRGCYPWVCEIHATQLSGLLALRRKAGGKASFSIFKHKMETLY